MSKYIWVWYGGTYIFVPQAAIHVEKKNPANVTKGNSAYVTVSVSAALWQTAVWLELASANKDVTNNY